MSANSSEENESYKQPIELADPTLYQHDGKYYLYGTDPKPEGGFRTYVSDDLTNWKMPDSTKEEGYVLKKGRHVYGNKGFWAPQIFSYEGKVYIAYTANEHIAIAMSDNPVGPFAQESVKPLNPFKQIDPFIFFDDDGKIYMYCVRFNNGNHIFTVELTDDLKETKENTQTHCISAHENTWELTRSYLTENGDTFAVMEGPTVIKHKGTYYLFFSANHFISKDYAVGYATAPTPKGPWTRYEGNPIIKRDIIGIDGTGHGDILVDTDKQLYYVFHTHAKNGQVHPRQTYLVKMHFEEGENALDKVVVDKETVRKLYFSE